MRFYFHIHRLRSIQAGLTGIRGPPGASLELVLRFGLGG
jgi:hypothetical protein